MPRCETAEATKPANRALGETQPTGTARTSNRVSSRPRRRGDSCVVRKGGPAPQLAGRGPSILAAIFIVVAQPPSRIVADDDFSALTSAYARAVPDVRTLEIAAEQ